MRSKTKLTIDVLMIIGMFFSISLHLFGAGTHKILGLLTFVLFVVHNILNIRWYGSLFKGKYKGIRIAHTTTNIVVIVAMFGIMASGVLLSKEMASGIIGTRTVGRALHLASSYVGCAGIALHIGFHLKRRAENV